MAGTDHLAITVRSEIPIARGLGSSAALAVAAAAAAGRSDPLAVAAQMDGHPENAAASIVGGLVAAALVKGVSGGPPAARHGAGLRGARSRQDPVHDQGPPGAPSETVPRAGAFNLARMGLMLAGLADSRVLIREATEDRIHQDYRSPLFPEAPKLLAGLSKRVGPSPSAGRAPGLRCSAYAMARTRGCGAGEKAMAEAAWPDGCSCSTQTGKA